jgi:hypothetical protein
MTYLYHKKIVVTNSCHETDHRSDLFLFSGPAKQSIALVPLPQRLGRDPFIPPISHSQSAESMLLDKLFIVLLNAAKAIW